jgi:hypothetical protein
MQKQGTRVRNDNEDIYGVRRGNLEEREPGSVIVSDAIYFILLQGFSCFMGIKGRRFGRQRMWLILTNASLD